MYDPVSPKEMGDKVHASFERMELTDPSSFYQITRKLKAFSFLHGLNISY